MTRRKRMYTFKQKESKTKLRLSQEKQCIKSVRVSNFSGPHFPALGLKTEIYSVNPCIQSECGKIQTRKVNTFHAVKRTE